MASKLTNAVSNMLSRCASTYRPVPVGLRLERTLVSGKQSIRAAAAAGDIVGDVDWTEDMPVPVKRRVAALREVQKQYDTLMKDFIRERAELQAKYEKQAEPFLSQRQAIVAGKQAVDSFDIPDSDEPDQGIPDFWLTAIANHDMLGEYVTERDAEVLSYLTDVRVVSLTGDEAGSFRVEFHFAENPYFSNSVLEKTFYMENPDEVLPDKFVGCTIDWAPGKDTTVTLVKKKKMAGKKGKGAPPVSVTQSQPCDSFFNFFKTPAIPESPEDMTEEELEALQQQMDEDFEIATAFKDSLVPHAVEWFTGEIAPPMFDEFDEDEFEAYEDEPKLPAPRRR